MTDAKSHFQEIMGPDIAIVGWIPRRWLLPGLRRPNPPNMRRLTFREWTALRLLHIALSNRRPPISLADKRGFTAFVQSKQFRGAITLERIRLQLNSSGEAKALVFEEDEHVGYTPYPLWGGPGAIPSGPGLIKYRRGLMGIPEPTRVLVMPDRGVIVKTFRFRLDEWGDSHSRALVGAAAPDAWISVKYEIRLCGQVRVEFSGSFVPSQWYYASWNVVGDHDMGNNSAAHTLSFFHAGPAAKSPGQVHFTWT